MPLSVADVNICSQNVQFVLGAQGTKKKEQASKPKKPARSAASGGSWRNLDTGMLDTIYQSHTALPSFEDLVMVCPEIYFAIALIFSRRMECFSSAAKGISTCWMKSLVRIIIGLFH